MSKRSKKLEQEAIEQGLTPTKDLKADEEKPQYRVPWTGLIVIGSLAILITICIIVICCMGGPIQ